jgi:hypothetical protein
MIRLEAYIDGEEQEEMFVVSNKDMSRESTIDEMTILFYQLLAGMGYTCRYPEEE